MSATVPTFRADAIQKLSAWHLAEIDDSNTTDYERALAKERAVLAMEELLAVLRATEEGSA